MDACKRMYLRWQMRVGIHLICNCMWMWWLYFQIEKTKAAGIATSKLHCIGQLVQLILVSKLVYAGDWSEECHQVLNHMT